jgi:hypothetical protein
LPESELSERCLNPSSKQNVPGRLVGELELRGSPMGDGESESGELTELTTIGWDNSDDGIIDKTAPTR